MPPKQVIELLNKYFAKVTKVIHKHHGTVDKFMGDGVMAMAFFDDCPAPHVSPTVFLHFTLQWRIVWLNLWHRTWDG